MVKLLNLVDPRVLLLEMEEKELPEEFVVSERGLAFLKERVAALNKKAAKYKVPSIDIDIVKEEMVKALHPDLKKMQMSQSIIIPLDKGIIDDPNSWVLVKQFTIRIDGEPPHIEGYEFIARLEHTPEGNFIYTNPKSSVPNLPNEYKSMNQHCDICHTNRDRNDTFVIKMTKDDPLRFPNKKAGDLLVVGRNCLARFLPGISVAGLIMWTKMIDNLKDDIKAAGELKDEDGGYGGGGKYYEDADHLLTYLVGVYLQTGKYISKKFAQASQDQANMGTGKAVESTLSRALHEMRPGPKADAHSHPVYFKLKDDEAFKSKVDAMKIEFEEWLKTKDFDAMAAAKPDFSDFFHNIKLVAAQDYLRGNHFGFYAALFQLFLRDKGELEKKKSAADALAALPPSPVTFDASMTKKRLRDIAKENEVKRLVASGMDEKAIKKSIRGKVWGWEVTVKKLTEYEKTQTFGYGDSGIGYRIFFQDPYGNEFLWFASTSDGFIEGGKYLIDGTVTGYEAQNKYSGRPQTRINRVRIIKDFQQPDKPPQPETPPTEPIPVTPVA